MQDNPRNTGRPINRTGTNSTNRTASNTSSRNTTVQRSREVRAQNDAYNRQLSMQATPVPVEVDYHYPVTPVGTGQYKCYKCKSTDVIPVKKGYSVGKFLITFLLSSLVGVLLCLVIVGFFFIDPFNETVNISLAFISFLVGLFILLINLPISIIIGFVGRNKMVHTCMNCGRRWVPGGKA